MSQDTDRAEGKPPSVDRLSALWRRVHERKIAQWSLAYVALAYGIQHGVVLTAEAFDWPHAVQQISMLLLALGLPVTMTFAWYHGERASRRISGPELTIIAILLAIGSLFFYVLVKPQGEVEARAVEPTVAAARSATRNPGGTISVAVLPFVNLSSDKEQEFFSDGMTEEITAALAKVPDLKVVARTSAFEFKGKNVDVEQIGAQLHATHLIEGSVRKAGDKLRITAQLIKADDGTHIWAEDYDRELTDVFAIQEDIARAITASLRMPLGLKPGENLVANRNVDVEVYQEFLRLRAQERALPVIRIFREVTPAFEKLVARQPNFAPARAYLSRVYLATLSVMDRAIMTRPPEETQRLQQPVFDKMEKAAREAIRLDPRQAVAYAALALVEKNQKHWASASDLLRKAQELDPYDPDILSDYGDFLLQTGRIKDAFGVLQQAHALEPLVGNYGDLLAEAYMADNQPAAAIAMLEAIPIHATGYYQWLAQAYAMMGRFNDAANSILMVSPAFFGGEEARERGSQIREQAAQLIRTAPRKAGDPSTLPALTGRQDFIYFYVGAPDRLLDYPERSIKAGELIATDLFAANYAPVRKTERFKRLIREAGLVDYWKERGWPDLCHPTTGDDDFACE